MAGAGKITATKLKHLTAHAIEPLQSSGGQHGVSELPAIDISTGFEEMVAPPVTGTRATEMAIKAAKIARARVIGRLSGDVNWGSTARSSF